MDLGLRQQVEHLSITFMTLDLDPSPLIHNLYHHSQTVIIRTTLRLNFYGHLIDPAPKVRDQTPLSSSQVFHIELGKAPKNIEFGETRKNEQSREASCCKTE